MVKYHNEYIAVGGNRHPSAADWDVTNGLVAFGADRNVALWRPLVLQTLSRYCRHAHCADRITIIGALQGCCVVTRIMSMLLSSFQQWQANLK